jgi:hypothetical protein
MKTKEHQSSIARHAVVARQRNILLRLSKEIVNAPRNKNGEIVISTKPDADAFYQKLLAGIKTAEKNDD